jgi:hypothetical protein
MNRPLGDLLNCWGVQRTVASYLECLVARLRAHGRRGRQSQPGTATISSFAAGSIIAGRVCQEVNARCVGRRGANGQTKDRGRISCATEAPMRRNLKNTRLISKNWLFLDRGRDDKSHKTRTNPRYNTRRGRSSNRRTSACRSGTPSLHLHDDIPTDYNAARGRCSCPRLRQPIAST